MATIIETERLLLKEWEPKHLEALASLNADPEVMEYFPKVLTFEESKAQYEFMIKRHQEIGYCFLATEIKSTGETIGIIGLNIPVTPLPFAPCTEVGWRLAKKYWGKGYAQEGARACLKYGFDNLALKEIVAITAVGNQRSRNVMEKIGMTYDPTADFMHPKVPKESPHALHVLYRIPKTSSL